MMLRIETRMSSRGSMWWRRTKSNDWQLPQWSLRCSAATSDEHDVMWWRQQLRCP